MAARFVLGMDVMCSDGAAGRVSRIVTDPARLHPRYLVVQKGRLRRREIVVPVSLVAGISAHGVRLDMTLKALAAFPDFEVKVRQGSYSKPVPMGGTRPIGIYTSPGNAGFMVLRQRNVPDQSVAVEKGMPVRDRARRKVGTVEAIIANSTTRWGDFIVVRRVPATTDLRLVPVELVAGAKDGEIRLRIDAAHVDGLRVFRPSAWERSETA